jgi:hypothetical protein
LNRTRTSGLVAILAVLLALHAPPALTAVNAVTGGIGGINNGTLAGGDGTGTARIELTSVELALVKQARDLSGTVLPGGSNVRPGQELYFVLYLDNPTPVAVSDIRFTDLLSDAQFSYEAGSLAETVVASGSADAAIWAGTWTPLTDAVGAPDVGASATDTGGRPGFIDRITIGAEPTQKNQTVDVPPFSMRAFRFKVRVN